MEHQLRRGIYRPKAQCLSISLAPLVAQRSLMFRVKTTKTSYAELTPTEESPALYTLSGSPQIVSAVLTAISAVISAPMSSASVYSQDSWKTASPSIPVVEVDSRQMAITFSPSVQRSDIANIAKADNEKESTTKSTLVLSVSTPPPEVNKVNDTESHSKPDLMPSFVNNTVRESARSLVDVVSRSTFGKRLTKIDQQSPKRSKSSKVFRKVMARLSFQPSKRKPAHLQRADSVAIFDNLRFPDFRLSEFRVSPIRNSFIV